MGQHTTAKAKFTGAIILGTLTAGALATGGLGSAPTANATCASFFGINNGGGCTSNLTSIAIAIGTGATANASGLFGAAFAVGNNASAIGFDGIFNVAAAVGDNNHAAADFVLTFAAALGGNNASAGAGGPGGLADLAVNVGGNLNNAQADGLGVLAVNFLGSTTGAASAQGVGDVAVNVGGYYAGVQGNFSNATNLLSPGSQVQALHPPNSEANLSWAFSILGSNNTVQAGYGPLAVAGSLFQTGATITKVGPGFNINGVVVGGATAIRNAKTSAPTATAVRTGRQTAAPAAAAHTPTKKPATSAAATGRGKR
jgi:hypothetical protein